MTATDFYTIGVRNGDNPVEVAEAFLNKHVTRTGNDKVNHLNYDLASIIQLKLDENNHKMVINEQDNNALKANNNTSNKIYLNNSDTNNNQQNNNQQSTSLC